MPRRKELRIADAVLEQLLAGADPKTVFDPNGLIDDLKKALAERVLNAQTDHHLAGEEPSNRRNGYGRKRVITRGQKLGALVLLEPQPQDFLGTVGAHAQRDVDGFVAHQALVADLDPQCVEENQRVGRLARPDQRGDRRGA
jgi:hypothetical protein